MQISGPGRWGVLRQVGGVDLGFWSDVPVFQKGGSGGKRTKVMCDAAFDIGPKVPGGQEKKTG